MRKSKVTDEEKKEFVVLVAHRLKNPISSIKLSLEMLLEGDFGALSEEQRKIVERIYQKNNTLIYIIDDLFNLVQVAKKDFYHFELVDIKKIIQSVIDCDQEEIKKREIVVRVEGQEAKLPKLMLDKEKIFLAIQNIFDNAIKYSNVGGEVLVSFGIKGDNLELRIKDHSIGILDSEKDKIFTEFFRGKNAKEMKFAGSGLGFYITKNIIQNHNGKIWVESEENKGSTFFVTLPLRQ